MIEVVNVIPNALSGESNQDSEPSIAVNTAAPNQIAITAFTPNPTGGANAPIFISTDGGATWALNTNVPSQAGSSSGTGDIKTAFGATGNRFYGGILRRPGNLRLNILRANAFNAAGTMNILVDRNQVDQPFTEATTVPSGPDAGDDRVYVGLNDFNAPAGRTATVEFSLDAGAATAAFTTARIEPRSTGTAGQNGPQIRPAVHSDGTVYAIYYGWRSFGTGSVVTSDVVVVRDDAWGTGTAPFGDLTDPSDGLAGRLVTTGVRFTWDDRLGQERTGGDLSIAVDPTDSDTVYIAYCDDQSGIYTLHVRRSLDRGVTWSNDVATVANAKNPCLAINSQRKVGLAYQQVVGTGASARWETHLELTTDGFATIQDFVLADVPATTPAPQFLPYIGDYMHMMAVGTTFYGVFSANNTPDLANFPNGVTFLRNADFGTNRLLALDGATQVPVSIDPFFFKHTESISVTRLTPLTRFTALTHLTRFTGMTRLTRLTGLTRLTRLTHLTRFTGFTRITRLTHFTRFTPLTGLTRFTRIPFTRLPPLTRPIEPGPFPRGVEPFLRFGNTILTPEALDLARFEEVEGVLDELASIGILSLHQLVGADPNLLAAQLGYSRDDAQRLVLTAQMLLRGLAQ